MKYLILSTVLCSAVSVMGCVQPAVAAETSPIQSIVVQQGSEVSGEGQALLDLFKISSPLYLMDPLITFPCGCGSRFKILRAVVVFPAPVSPTSPSVCPLSSSSDTPFTA